MQCPECQAEQLTARYCVRCGARMQATTPGRDPLDVVPESPGIPADAGSSGTFAYGRDNPEAPVFEPSDWTQPLRMSVLGWLAFSALFDFYYLSRLPALLAGWLVVKAFLAVGAYGGRTTWVFYACMAVVAVNVAAGMVALWVVLVDVSHGRAAASPEVVLLVGVAGAALLAWMVVALRRHGPWAARLTRPS